MRHATLLLASLLVACSGGELSVRQQFLAESGASVQFDIWVRSINNQNQDSLGLIYHQVPELRSINVDGKVSRGWDEVAQHWSEFFELARSVNFVTDVHEIEVLTEDLVLMTFRYSLDTERDDGEPGLSVSGRGSMVWSGDVEDDLWKIHTQHLSVRLGSGEVLR